MFAGDLRGFFMLQIKFVSVFCRPVFCRFSRPKSVQANDVAGAGRQPGIWLLHVICFVEKKLYDMSGWFETGAALKKEAQLPAGENGPVKTNRLG